MLKRIFLLVAMLFTVTALADTKTFTLEPATERDDGTPMPLSEIARHPIECRVNGGEWQMTLDIQMPAVSAPHDFGVGSWECRAYTVDTVGQLSATASNTVSFDVRPALPTAPGLAVQ